MMFWPPSNSPLRPWLRRMRARWLSLRLPRQVNFPQPPEERQATASLSLVVPVHDAPQVVARCLRSLESFAASAQVILVDDGSKLAETRSLLVEHAHRNQWRLLTHPQPKGHSRACEAGAQLADRPYICLLNSDTLLTPWCWHAEVEAFQRHARLAAVGPSTSRGSIRQRVAMADHCCEFWSDTQVFAFAQHYVSRHRHSPLLLVPRIGGFAFFIRRSVWEEYGGFDPQLPDYGNENELCIRLEKDRWEIGWTRSAYIHHLSGQTYGPSALAKTQAAHAYILGKHGTV